MRIAVIATAMLSLCVLAAQASAQRQITPYQPAKPAISPYLYLTLPDTGIMPNYQAFVEPIQGQQQLNTRQENEIRRLQQGQLEYAPAQTASTGTASVYGSISHYYPGGSGASQRGGAPRQAGNRNTQRRVQSPYQPAMQAQGMNGAGMGNGFF